MFDARKNRWMVEQGKTENKVHRLFKQDDEVHNHRSHQKDLIRWISSERSHQKDLIRWISSERSHQMDLIRKISSGRSNAERNGEPWPSKSARTDMITEEEEEEEEEEEGEENLPLFTQN